MEYDSHACTCACAASKDQDPVVQMLDSAVVQKANSTIQRISFYPVDSAILLVSPILIHWIVIYPVDSAIQLLNNWSQINQYSVDTY